jgi:FAD/FMN-containing dehydrogenase
MPGLRPCGFGHFGDGNIHYNLTQPPGLDREAFLAEWGRFNRIVHDIVAEMGGSIAAEHGVGLIKRDELARYASPAGLDLMRAVKAAIDPRNLMNPGKVVPPVESVANPSHPRPHPEVPASAGLEGGFQKAP